MEAPSGAASVIILKDGEALVVAKGQKLQLIGGKTEREDASPEDTAVRETKEEAGIVLDPKLLQPVAKMKFKKDGRNRMHHFFLYHVAGTVDPTGPKPLFWKPVWRLRKKQLFVSWVYAWAVKAAIRRICGYQNTTAKAPA